MSFQRLILIALAALSARAMADFSESDLNDSILSLNAYEGTELVRTGSGFVIQSTGRDAFIITSAALLAGETAMTALSPAGMEMTAAVLRVDAPIDFALLRVNDLGGTPLVMSKTSPAVGDPVWSVTRQSGARQPGARQPGALGLSKGVLVNAYTMPGQTVGILSHSATVAGDAGASILLNECGEVAGINLGFGSSDGSTRALDGSAIRTLLAREKVSVSEAARPCVSAMVQARQQAEMATEAAQRAGERATEAQGIARSLEQRLQVSTEANAALEARAREAREKADAALQVAAQAQRDAEDTRREMERQTASIKAETEAVMRYLERDRVAAEERFRSALEAQGRVADATRNQLWLALFAILVFVVIFAILVLRRSGSNPAASVANEPGVQKGQKSAGPLPGGATVMHNEKLSEYVLDGRDEDGIRYLLRISGDQLVNPDGIVIGRNPQDSPYTINHADVSRKHARMRVMKNRVFIEDLGSTNGTSVNGQSIDEKGPIAVNNGDQIIIGSVVMKLRVLGA